MNYLLMLGIYQSKHAHCSIYFSNINTVLTYLYFISYSENGSFIVEKRIFRSIQGDPNSTFQYYMVHNMDSIFKNIFKVGCVLLMVIWLEFRMWQYKTGDHTLRVHLFGCNIWALHEILFLEKSLFCFYFVTVVKFVNNVVNKKNK